MTDDQTTGRKPRKATSKSLENAAVYYLNRFDASAEQLRRVLLRRVNRSARYHGTDFELGKVIVTELVERFQELGMIDDARYAGARARTFHARGSSLRTIRAKLRMKGVMTADIETAIEALLETEGQPDFVTAASLARRRRLGPYRDQKIRHMKREPDLAALARAGFDYDVARHVIDSPSVETLEEELSPPHLRR